MGKEIERKFLVNPKLWDIAEKPAGVFYRQGYIPDFVTYFSLSKNPAKFSQILRF